MFNKTSLVRRLFLTPRCSRLINNNHEVFKIRQFSTLGELQYIAKPTQIPRKITKIAIKNRKPEFESGSESNLVTSTFTGTGPDSQLNTSFSRSKDELTTYLNHTIKPVVSATTCEEYDLAKVKALLSLKGIANSEIVSGETVYFKFQKPSNSDSNSDFGDVFVMKSGTVIAWNVEEDDVISSVVPLFKDGMITSYSIETEDLDFIDLGKGDSTEEATADPLAQNGGSFISKEIICLKGSNEETLLDKVAFSYGISRSTRLAILESSLEKHIKLTKKTTENLSKGKHLGVNAKDVIKSSGRLLLLRGKLNLYSELIETPDLYWDEPSLEKIYNDISKVLDVNSRVNLLNRKLDYASEEAQSLVDLLKSRKESGLEWIIIYLIVIEVCFETYHFYERFIEKNDQIEAKI